MALSTGMIQGVEYVFTTSGDGQVKAVLKSQYDAMQKAAVAAQKVGTESKKAGTSTAGLGEAAKKSATAFDSAGAALKRMVAPIAVIYAAVKAFKFVANAVMDQEEATNSLNASLRQTGVYTDELTAALHKNATALMNQTIYGDEAILSGTALMQNIGKLGSDMLPAAQKAAIGLAAAYKQDLNTAFSLVGKAAAGNTATLGRLGIVLDEGGTKQEKFTQLMEIGAKAYAVAEAQSNTLRGKLIQLKNTIGEAAERAISAKSVFDGILVGFNAGLIAALRNMDDVSRKTEEMTNKTAIKIGKFFSNVVVMLSFLPRMVGDVALLVVNVVVQAAMQISNLMMGIVKMSLEVVKQFALMPLRIINAIKTGDWKSIGVAMFEPFANVGEKTWSKMSDDFKSYMIPAVTMLKDDLAKMGLSFEEGNVNVENKYKTKKLPIIPLPPDDITGAGTGGAGTDTGSMRSKHRSALEYLQKQVETLVKLRDAALKYVGALYGHKDYAALRQKELDQLNATFDVVSELGASYEQYSYLRSKQIQAEIADLAKLGVANGLLMDLEMQRMSKLDAEYAEYWMSTHQEITNMMQGAVSSFVHGISSIIESGGKMAWTLKNIFGDFASYAIQQIEMIIAKMLALFAIKSALNLATGGVAGLFMSVMGLTAGAAAGAGVGTLSYGGGGGTTMALPSPNTNGMNTVIRELQALRRDVYQAQPSSVKMNFRKGELAYAVAADNRYRVNL